MDLLKQKALKQFSMLSRSALFERFPHIALCAREGKNQGKKKAPDSFLIGAKKNLATTYSPHTLAYSTIGDERLNC